MDSLASTLISAFTGGTGGTNDFANQSISGSYTGANGTLIGTEGFPAKYPTAPMAFLNVLFIPGDESITIGEDHFAYDQIQVDATQSVSSGVSDPFDKLSVENYEVPGHGYLLVYISNEGMEKIPVHFDDIEVTLKQKELTQANDYYPFGLTFNSYERVGNTKNDYLYQGKEQLENLDWYDFHARRYHPALGRFMQVDPQGQFASGYVGMGNNPVMGVDPDGELVWSQY